MIRTEIGPAHLQDYSSFAALFPAMGVDNPIPSEARWCAEMLPSMIMARQDGRVVGDAYFQLLRDTGYVRQIVVASAARRGGVGRALMEELRGRFRGGGARAWCLNVDVTNVAARRLYERAGLKARYRSVPLRIPWSIVATLGGPVFPVDVGPIETPADAAFERAFGLPEGQFTEARSRPNCILMGAVRRDDGAPAALAVFKPAFPGAFPFRVGHPSIAPELLLSLRPHALPQHDYMQIVAEDAADLVTMLLAAGATQRFEMLHLQGEL